MALEVYHVGASVMGTEDQPLSVYHVGADLMTPDGGDLSAFHVGAQLLHKPVSVVIAYHVGVQAMFRAEVDPFTGGYEENERRLLPVEVDAMIYTDIIFPLCISYGSSSVPRYETVKSEVLSGDETRQSRWRYPKHEYSINMEDMNAMEISEIMNIWHVCSGDHIAFLFMDPLDHTSKNTAASFSGSQVSSTDQEVGSAVGGQTNYPLYKYYQMNSRLKRRLIRYPKADTVLVRVGNHDTTQFEIDATNPEATLKFTLPVVDEQFTITKVGNAITLDDAGDWSLLFNVGDFVHMDGFTNTDNDTSAVAARVISIAGATMVLENQDGTTYGSTDEASVLITFNSGVPATGQPITAGFYFYVPVRFEEGDSATSEIKAGQRESAFADFTDIKLKEVFE